MDTKGYRLFIYDNVDEGDEEDLDRVRSDYWEQIINNEKWLSITDQIYTKLDENGWKNDLISNNGNTEKCNFYVKIINIRKKHKIGIIDKEKNVILFFSEFDIEMKKQTKIPFKLSMYIDYDSGNVFIIKY